MDSTGAEHPPYVDPHQTPTHEHKCSELSIVSKPAIFSHFALYSLMQLHCMTSQAHQQKSPKLKQLGRLLLGPRNSCAPRYPSLLGLSSASAISMGPGPRVMAKFSPSPRSFSQNGPQMTWLASSNLFLPWSLHHIKIKDTCGSFSLSNFSHFFLEYKLRKPRLFGVTTIS